MSEFEVFLDDTPGEMRGVVARDGRFDRLLIQRESDLPQHRLGARSVGRVTAVDGGLRGAFVDLGAPEPFGFLPLRKGERVAVGRRLLEKAADEAEAVRFLKLLSGRNHRVFTGVAVAAGGAIRHRVVEARVSFKVLSDAEIAAYVRSEEWRGKAGGYGIQGRAGAFVTRIVGSYPAIVGLPLHETVNLLAGAGWRAQ